MSLEEEAKKFLQQRNQGNEPDQLREELIKMLEWFLEQLKRRGLNGPLFSMLLCKLLQS